MLDNYSYCPTLYARQAEIRALTQLPSVTKDKLFPLIVIRPWPKAKHLTKTWEKVKEALGKHRFAADLDDFARDSGKPYPAAAEFDSLFEPAGGFTKYYGAVAVVDEAVPVLRTSAGVVVEFDAQADHIDKIDRGLVLRINHDDGGDFTKLIDLVLDRFEDVSIFVDAGWSKDILAREMWTSSVIEHASRSRPEIELVVAGSSFPETFANIEERGVNPVQERYLYENLVRRHNSAVLIYGDWGSTRPPCVATPMTNVPRIDLPMSKEWISFRRDKEVQGGEDYSDIAKRVISDKAWLKTLDVWGARIIEWTAKGEDIAIRGPATAAASRINIHLHKQAFFDAPTIVSDGDEPFTDD